MDFQDHLERVNHCDPDDPLLSETDLGNQLNKIPLEAITNRLDNLCQDLDMERLIKTGAGLSRDYRGLGELMQFSAIEIETRFKKSYKPTRSLIDAFINKNLRENRVVAVKDLLKMLEKLERFDIVDDTLPILIEIAQQHLESVRNRAASINLCRIQRAHPNVDPVNGLVPLNHDFSEQLTIDDVDNCRMLYDAFVCFAPEDYMHAQELIALLESFGKRLATSQDILAGKLEHDSLVRLIDTRCRKFLTILTPNFLVSKECEFQIKFASELANKSGQTSKIIPLMFENCDDSQLPYMIRVLSKIDMTNRGAHKWRLERLVRSLDADNQEAGTLQPQIAFHHDRMNSLNQFDLRQAVSNETRSQGGAIYKATGSMEPIIELAPSPSNSLKIITTQQEAGGPTEPPASSPGGRLTNTNLPTASSSVGRLFKQVKSKLMRSTKPTTSSRNLVGSSSPSPSFSSASSISPSTSSRAILLTSDSTRLNLSSASNLDSG